MTDYQRLRRVPDSAGMKRAAIIIMILIATPQILPVQASMVDSAPLPASVTQAMERFEAAGLELPPLDIRVHDTKAGCSGHSGLYTPGAESDQIDICTDATFIILHELGHAWEYRNATDSARKVLMEDLGLDAWSGSDVDYRQRGEEVAASLLAWGLIERPLTEAETRTSVDTLARFASLTGVPSPRVTG